jgi:hypothetical protein
VAVADVELDGWSAVADAELVDPFRWLGAVAAAVFLFGAAAGYLWSCG